MAVSAQQCSACKSPLQAEERFCSQCGQSTARIYWYSSPDPQPREGASAITDGGLFYLVARNAGTDAARVFVDAARLRGLQLVGSSEAWIERGQSAAFALQHTSGEPVGGVVLMQSEDGPRPRPSFKDPQASWWQPRGLRQQQYRAQNIVRVVKDHWVIGADSVLFPPGVRKQQVRIWNDSEKSRVFDTDIPAGYRVLLDGADIDRRPPEIAASASAELNLVALSERVVREVDPSWNTSPDTSPVSLKRLTAPSPDAGPDVVIAIDFGTRNTGVRVRWRHELVSGKPAGSVDIVSDKQSAPRFPSEMAIHRAGRTFQWGSDVPRGILPPDVVRISNLKTYLRVGEDRYARENPQWTNAYLLERYFEQIFYRIDEYFSSVGKGVYRQNLNIQYVISRPVMDAAESGSAGKRYEQALALALSRCGVDQNSIQFVFEPSAAAYGVARRRITELYMLGEGALIAVVDAGGGTTDIALAKISLRQGMLTLTIAGAYALHLESGNPALAAICHFGAADRLELGGDVIDYALTHRLLTDAAGLLGTSSKPVPAKLEFLGPAKSTEDAAKRETELLAVCRRLKEAFAYNSTQRIAQGAAPMRPNEQCIFVNRPEYEGVYLDQTLIGEELIAPILRSPVELLHAQMEQQSAVSGVRPSQVRQVFYVGGTDIEYYYRLEMSKAFPNSPRLQPEGADGVEDRIYARLNAVVEGAVWWGEPLYAASALDLRVSIQGQEKELLKQGDPLPPERAAPLRPFLVRLDPVQELEASLIAGDGEDSLVVARAFYRNATDAVQDGALQVRISRERGVEAVLVIAGTERPQWRFALVEG